MTLDTASSHWQPWHTGTKSIWHSSQTNPTMPDHPRQERADVCVTLHRGGVVFQNLGSKEQSFYPMNSAKTFHPQVLVEPRIWSSYRSVSAKAGHTSQRVQQQHSDYCASLDLLAWDFCLHPSRQSDFQLPVQPLWSHTVTIFCCVISLSLTEHAGSQD